MDWLCISLSPISALAAGLAVGSFACHLWRRLLFTLQNINNKPHRAMGLIPIFIIKLLLIGTLSTLLLRCGIINFILFLGVFFITSGLGAWRAI